MEQNHRSPPIGAVAVVFVVLFASSIAVIMTLTHGAAYPTPYRTLAELNDYYAQHAGAFEWGGFLQFAAMMPFGVLVASVVSRLRFHGVDVAGVYIALFGGIGAALFLGISALSNWVLSQPGVATDTGAMRAMQLMAFATGGFGHTAALGLFLAGVSLPCLAFRLLPRWIVWTGLTLAAIAELSTLGLVFPKLAVLLPIARFPAYLWLIALGFALPRSRSLLTASPSLRATVQPAE
jgi:hypothetical protein